MTLLKNANLRESASTSSESKVVIPFGLVVSSDERITNEDGEVWYKVSYAGVAGYIREDMVSAEAVKVAENTEETQEGEEGEEGTEENAENTGEENAEETVENTETTGEDSNVVTPAQIISNTGSSDDGFVEANKLYTSDEDFGSSNEKEAPKRRKFDFVVVLFFAMAAFIFGLALFTIGKLRYDYRKFKNYIIKNRGKQSAEQN